MCAVSGAETTVTMRVNAQHLCTRPRTDVTIPGIATGSQKLRQPAGAGPPAGDAVERVDIGHTRGSSLRAMVDCGASNNFVRLQSLARLDFEEVELPRSQLEVRLATGVVVRTEKRVVRARFSYEEKKFVDELIVLDLDDKFDMVLGMPWLARHDPVIDWAKRTIVRFRSSGATESDGPVGAAHAPRGACDPPAEAAPGAAASDLSVRTLTTERVVREKCEPNQRTQIRSDLRGSRSVKGDAAVSTVVDTQVEQEWPVTEGSDLGASAPGANAIGPNIKGRSAVRRREKRGASAPEPTPQAVRAVANVPHRKCLRTHVLPGCTTKRYTIKPGLIACVRGMIPPTNKSMCARVHLGCTTKPNTIKLGLVACAHGLIPPAIRRLRARVRWAARRSDTQSSWAWLRAPTG
ncbi:unnamed protein product [Phytophthora fragariaefolia]|uniref:Unnamed protein product n=1 Tax=Phytophthora fragariaefolia TaxID=1490495 RepID=A0A9W7D8B9_9STRA|nr:unnamed protein product [Phytophthora fragariaefolia]